MNPRQAAIRFLDNPPGRYLLGLLGSLYVTIKREPCRIRYRDGQWIHRYRSQIFVAPTIGGPSAVAQRAETDDIYLHAYSPAAGDLILDVGAGLGTEVVTFSRLVGSKGRVVAIEAHPDTYRYLLENVRANSLHNVVPLNLAVAAQPGTVTITNRERHVTNTIVGREAVDGIEISADTIDNIVSRQELPRIDLLKINIEGAELAALQGASKALRIARNVYVSCHDFEADRAGNEVMRTRRAVIKLLNSAGFKMRSRDSDPRPWVRDALYGQAPAQARESPFRHGS